MSCRSILRSLLFAFILFPTASGHADTLISRSGDKLLGQVVDFNSDVCLYLTSMNNTPIEIPWTMIRSLKSDAQFTLNMADGDRISGTLGYTAGKGITIKSPQSSSSVNLAHIMNVHLISEPTQPQSTTVIAAPENRKLTAPLARTAMSTSEVKNNETNQVQQAAPLIFGDEDTEESPPITFLRGSSILLAPGQIEGRLVFGYQPQKVYTYGTAQQRSFNTSLALNVGLHERLEGWVNVPFGYVRGHEDSFLRQERDSEFGIRDVSFGINTMLLAESESWPELTMTLAATAPTGSSPYDAYEMIGLGSGHWTTDVGVQFVRSVDPVILFGGLSAGYIWPRHQDNREFSYGWQWDYNFGFGFAINEKVSISNSFHGSYQPPLKADGNTDGRFSADLNYWYIFHDRYNNDAVVYEAYWTGVQGIYSQATINGNIDYYNDRNSGTQIFRVDWNTGSLHINSGTNRVIDWSNNATFGQFKGFVGIPSFGYFYGLPKPPYGSTLHVRI